MVNTERQITVFDLEGQSKMLVYKDAHDRMINKVVWDLNNENCFLTVSSDKQMKLYDNNSETAIITLTNQSDGYLDAKFSKQHPNLLAAAKDNGEIELWDMRAPSFSLLQRRIHIGSVSSLDWNSANNLLLSGSIDRHIKAHRLFTGGALEQVADIGSYTGVGIVKWQQNEEFTFDVSFMQHSETAVFKYNLLLPNFPVAVYRGHSDVVTDFAWINQSSYLLTSSRDCNVIMRHKIFAAYPLLSVNTVGMGFTLNNELVHYNNKFFPKVLYMWLA
eukprot:TRINITY_DN218_c0_g2_i2.p1 TRINITY_DN218_c0_g2~~TRINITY_DN218_c0_g2_i2.p1  ORF type:complete len:275 (-),score=31.85 TRINITY_DN218_c0_g2_i2:1352-2176(-)